MRKWKKLLDFVKNAKKTESRLRAKGNKRYYYCIEGSMCEVFRRETGEGCWVPSESFPGEYLFYLDGIEYATAPNRVWDWFGLCNSGAFVENDRTSDGLRKLAKKIIPKIGDTVKLECYGNKYTVKVRGFADNMLLGDFKSHGLEDFWIYGGFINPKEIEICSL